MYVLILTLLSNYFNYCTLFFGLVLKQYDKLYVINIKYILILIILQYITKIICKFVCITITDKYKSHIWSHSVLVQF